MTDLCSTATFCATQLTLCLRFLHKRPFRAGRIWANVSQACSLIKDDEVMKRVYILLDALECAQQGDGTPLILRNSMYAGS